MEIKPSKQFFYKVQPDFDEKNFYSKINTCSENILKTKPEIQCGDWIKVSVNDFRIHYVKPAETIESIAKFYHISAEEIVKMNKLTSEHLYIGQRLKIY